METLTREAAHTLVDAAAQMGGLSRLVVAWEPAGFWNPDAVWTADMLHQYVDECAEMLCDRTEACRDDSDTGLPDVDFDATEEG